MSSYMRSVTREMEEKVILEEEGELSDKETPPVNERKITDT